MSGRVKTVVAKIGTSSVTADDGKLSSPAIAKLCAEVAGLRAEGHRLLVVTSGSIAVGLEPMGLTATRRGKSEALLRAASAVGQISLMSQYQAEFASHGVPVGQVLLAPTDLWIRRRYLKSRGTLNTLLDAGVVPIVNENDAIADDEIRFGDNDRLAALVAHLVEADNLVLLTDTAGLFTADPRHDPSASLIEEIVEFDAQLEAMAGGPGSSSATGGMASKLAAAKIASWSGVETVISQANSNNVLAAVLSAPVGTVFRASSGRLPARKLWIAFAQRSSGRVVVDDGARAAVQERNKSLLVAGVTEVVGNFEPEDAVEISSTDGNVFAKGIMKWSSLEVEANIGRRTNELAEGLRPEVVHRDDLVVLPG